MTSSCAVKVKSYVCKCFLVDNASKHRSAKAVLRSMLQSKLISFYKLLSCKSWASDVLQLQPDSNNYNKLLTSTTTKGGSSVRYVQNLRGRYLAPWSVPYQRTVLQFNFWSVSCLRTVPCFLRTGSSINPVKQPSIRDTCDLCWRVFCLYLIRIIS